MYIITHKTQTLKLPDPQRPFPSLRPGVELPRRVGRDSDPLYLFIEADPVDKLKSAPEIKDFHLPTLNRMIPKATATVLWSGELPPPTHCEAFLARIEPHARVTIVQTRIEQQASWFNFVSEHSPTGMEILVVEGGLFRAIRRVERRAQ